LLSDEFQLEAVLDSDSTRALRSVLASLRDQAFHDLTLRFHVHPRADSFISQVMALDLRMNVGNMISGVSGGDESHRLAKRDYTSSDDSKSRSTIITCKANTARLLRAVKHRAQDYARSQFKKAVATIKVQSLLANADEARVRLILSLRRDILTYMSGMDFRLISGKIPRLKIGVYAELERNERLTRMRMGTVSVGARKCRAGPDDFVMDVTLAIRTDVMRDLTFQHGTRTIILKSNGSNLLSLVMDAFETCVQITPGRGLPEAFLTKKRSTHDHWSGQTFAQVQSFLAIDDDITQKRVHDLRLAVETDEDSLSAALGLAINKKPSVKAWPFARLEWSAFKFLLRPTFSERRLNRLYRNTTLAELDVLPGGTSMTLRPALNPMSLLHDGAMQIRLRVRRDGALWPRANLLDVVRLLLREYNPRSLRSLSVLHARQKRSPDRLVRLAYESLLSHAKLMGRDGRLAKRAKSMIQVDERMQVQVAGLNNARVNLMVPVPQTTRLIFPPPFRSEALRITLVLPTLRALLCNSPQHRTATILDIQELTLVLEHEKQYCPASAGIDAVLVKCSYIEIYNETIYDLLDPSGATCGLREDTKRGGVFVEGF